MRAAWATLIVLVLLAPFGRVGVTASPADGEAITAPRSVRTGAARVVSARPDGEGAAGAVVQVLFALPPVLAYLADVPRARTADASGAAVVAVAHHVRTPLGARAPPV